MPVKTTLVSALLSLIAFGCKGEKLNIIGIWENLWMNAKIQETS